LRREKYTLLWINFWARCTLIWGRREYTLST
jgi:hypothetical protein